MTAFKPQLVHESELQRQHVRVELPSARATLREKSCKVHNISAGGVLLKDVPDAFQKYEKTVLDLSLPFEAFTLNLSLPCIVEHYDVRTKTLGCAFTSLTDAQMSLLNAVIKSRMAGTIIDAGDILHIAGRSNMIRFNRDAEAAPLTTAQKIKRGSIFAAFLFVGAACLSLIAVNVYERLNIVKTAQAYVFVDTISVKAPVNGEFQFVLGENISKLRTGQHIGQVKTYLPENANGGNLIPTAVPVLSPCDCLIADTFVESGEFRLAGEPVMTLLPAGQRPKITARVPAAQAAHISGGQAASMIIEGKRINGIVQDIEIPEMDSGQAMVTIQPDEVLPLSALQKPATVSIRLR